MAPPRRNPAPDGLLAANYRVIEGDVWGPLKQQTPAIRFPQSSPAPMTRGSLSVAVFFSQPVLARNLVLKVTATEGCVIGMQGQGLGRYSTNHDTYVRNRNISPSLYDPSVILLCYEQLLTVSTSISQHEREYRIFYPGKPIVQRNVHNGFRFRDAGNWLETGPALVHGMVLRITASVVNWQEVPGRAVRIVLEQGGVQIVRRTLLIAPYHADFLESTDTEQRVLGSGAYVDLIQGDHGIDIPLFRGVGPGIPIDMTLQYRASRSAYWKAASVLEEKENYVYAPFGHGWSNPYTMCILSVESERRIGLGPRSPIETVVHLFFQDANGAIIEVSDYSHIEPNTWRLCHRGMSPAFGEKYDTLLLRRRGSGYVLTGEATQLIARFDADGQLTELERHDNGRSLTLQHGPGEVVIVDSCGRHTRLGISNGLVQRIDGPGNRSWALEYTEDSLTAIRHGGFGYEFDYDDETFQMIRVVAPTGIETTIHHLGAGSNNRLFAHTVNRVQEAGQTYRYQYQQTGRDDRSFQLTVIAPMNHTTTHVFGRSPSSNLSWVTVTDGNMKTRTLTDRLQLGGVEDGRGNQWYYMHDRSGRPVGQGWPNGTRETDEYDTQHPRHLSHQIDRMGARTDYTCRDIPGATGLIDTIRLPQGSPGEQDSIVSCDYDQWGNLATLTNPIGVVTEYERSTERGKRGLISKQTIRGLHGEELAEEFDYDDLGYLVRKVTDGNKVSVFRYNSLGKLEYERHPDGTELRREYASNGRVVREYCPGSNETSYVYNGRGWLEQEVIAEGGSIEYEYDDLGRRTRVTDAANLVTELLYDAAGHICTRKEDGEVVACYVHDEAGNVIQVRLRNAEDGIESVTDLAYNDCNLVVTVEYPEIDVNGIPWRPAIRIEYTPDGLVSKTTEEVDTGRECVTEYEYDMRRQLIKIKRWYPPEEFEEETFEYDRGGNLIMRAGPRFRWLSGTVPRAVIHAHNNRGQERLCFQRDGLGRVASVQNAHGETIASADYDSTGMIRALCIPTLSGTSAVDEVTYDPVTGRPSSLSNSYGRRSLITYDAAGRPKQVTDPFGATTTVAYDRRNRPIRVEVRGTNGSGSITETVYSPVGRVLETSQIVDGDRHTTTYEYNSAQSLVRRRNPLGKESRFTYDGYGRLKTRTDPNGTTSAYTYNKLGYITRIEYSTGYALNQRRDASGRLVLLEDHLFKKEIERDVQGRPMLVRLTDKTANRAVTKRFQYDTFGRLATLIDNENLATYYGYNSNGRLQLVWQGPAGGSRLRKAVFRYDQANRLTGIDHYPGQLQTRIEYDNGGFPRQIRNLFFGFTVASQITYDRDEAGRIEQASYAHLELFFSYEYDGLGRVKSEEIRHERKGLLYRAAWQYDAAGNRTASSVNDVRTTCDYNAFNQLVSINAARPVAIVSGLSAAADSQLDSQHGPNLAVDLRAPDSSAPGEAFVSAVTRVDHWIDIQLVQPVTLQALRVDLAADQGLPQKLGIGYRDPQDNTIKPIVPTFAAGAEIARSSAHSEYQDLVPRDTTIRLSFSPINTALLRIFQAQGDAPSGPSVRHPNALVVTEVAPLTMDVEHTALSYDDNGNLTMEGNRTYNYDQENRLARVSEPGVCNLEFMYAPDGTLVREIDHELGKTTNHCFLGAEIYGDYDAAGSVGRKVIPGHAADYKLGFTEFDQSTNPNGSTRFFLLDALATTHQIIEDTNAVLETRLTDAWGNPLYEEVERLASNPDSYLSEFGFAGRRSLGIDDLMDCRARVYHRKLGRFLTPDPAGVCDGLNRYSYCHNDPINKRDPYGLEAQESVPWAFMSGLAEGALLGLKALVNAVPETVTFGLYEADIVSVPPNPEDRRIYEAAGGPARVTTEAAFALLTVGLSAAAKGIQGSTLGARALRVATATMSTTMSVAEVGEGLYTGSQGAYEIRSGNYGTGALYLAIGALSLAGGGRGLKKLAAEGGPAALRPVIRYSRRLPADTLGETDSLGRILISDTLTGEALMSTVRHELFHRMLTPTSGPRWIRRLRTRFAIGAYWNSDFLRFTEELAAERHGQGSLMKALRSMNDANFLGEYNLSAYRVLGEPALAGGVLLGAVYGLRHRHDD